MQIVPAFPEAMIQRILKVLIVLSVSSAAFGLTANEASQFRHDYKCKASSGVTQASISASYAMGVTTITTNHLPNHDWECVNINAPVAATTSYSFSDVTMQTDDKVYCLPMGPIGIAKNGVYLFNPMTAYSGNAYTDEEMDCNGGHSDSEKRYHYHSLPDNGVVYNSSDSSSQFVGVAFDGVPIYSQGSGISEGDLDLCRGIYVGGVYRYIASVDIFPYFLGCYRGAPQDSSVLSQRKCSGMKAGDVCSCKHGIINFSTKRSLMNKLSRRSSTCGTTYCGDGSSVTCKP